MKTRHFYHFATKGWVDDILFASPDEFIAGVNRIALCLARLGPEHPVLVICFCLMDNHVHFILYGTEADCELFMYYYKQSTGLWLRHHRPDYCPGSRLQAGHWLIQDKDKLRTTISYIHRNPTAAGLPTTPEGYRWSSASLLYAGNEWLLKMGRPIGSLSVHERRAILNSKEDLPADWILLPDGLVWPGHYVAYQVMERQFDSVRDYQFVLGRKVEEEINLDMHASSVSLPDGEVASLAKDLAGQLFGSRQIGDLSVSQRLQLALRLKKESGATAKQVARIVRLKLSEVEPILNPRRG